jgi:hypothetical protein
MALAIKGIATCVRLGTSKSGNARLDAWTRSQTAAVSSDFPQLGASAK